MRPVQLPSVRAELDARFPFAAEVPERLYEPGTMALGRSADGPVAIGTRPRLEHAHIIGTTGGGKTNLLEHLIRQDIKNGDGVCVIDPPGTHPDSLDRAIM